MSVRGGEELLQAAAGDPRPAPLPVGPVHPAGRERALEHHRADLEFLERHLPRQAARGAGHVPPAQVLVAGVHRGMPGVQSAGEGPTEPEGNGGANDQVAAPVGSAWRNARAAARKGDWTRRAALLRPSEQALLASVLG